MGGHESWKPLGSLGPAPSRVFGSAPVPATTSPAVRCGASGAETSRLEPRNRRLKGAFEGVEPGIGGVLSMMLPGRVEAAKVESLEFGYANKRTVCRPIREVFTDWNEFSWILRIAISPPRSSSGSETGAGSSWIPRSRLPAARRWTQDHRCTVKILAAGPVGSSMTGVSPPVPIVHFRQGDPVDLCFRSRPRFPPDGLAARPQRQQSDWSGRTYRQSPRPPSPGENPAATPDKNSAIQ